MEDQQLTMQQVSSHYSIDVDQTLDKGQYS